ncbi:DNA-directed RNA polymerase I subunit rpa43 [Glycine soja]
MEGLKVSKANLTVYIHPSKSNQVSQAVLRQLSSLLFTFSEIFDGVVLAYDVNSFDTCAKILSGVHPYFGVKLKVNLLLFSPKPNMLLEGKVVKVTQESIHVVVLGFSSAIISEKDIREEFVCKTKRGQEVYVSRSHKRHVIKVGTMIRFLVKSWYQSGSYPPPSAAVRRRFNRRLQGFVRLEERNSAQLTAGPGASPRVVTHHLRARQTPARDHHAPPSPCRKRARLLPAVSSGSPESISAISFCFDEEILHVYGSLVPDHTGSIYWLDKNLEVDSHSDRSEKKRRIVPERIMLEQDAVDGELSTLNIGQKSKKSKKQKHQEES